MEFDDDRFFSGASRGDYLEALTAHAGLGSVVILDGAPGSGVSTLLGQAVMALLDDLEVVRIDGNDPHDGNVVVEALLRHFDIERAALADTLRHALVDGRIVVVVDNSDQLAAEALATMASLKQKLGARLGYFFGGSPGVGDQVQAAGFSVDDRLALPALAAEDIQDCAWFVLGLELDDEQSAALEEQTGGNLSAVLAALAPGSELVAAPVDDELRFGARDADDDADDVVSDDEYEADEYVEEDEAIEKTAPPWRHITAVAGLLVVVGLLWVALSSGPVTDPETRAIALPAPEGVVGDEEAEASETVAAIEPMMPTMEPVARLEDLSSRDPEVRREGGVLLEPVSDPVMQSEPPQKDTVMTLPPAEVEVESAGVVEDVAEAQQPPAVKGEAVALVDAEGYQHAGWLAAQDDERWFLQITATSQQEGARRVLDQIQRQGAYYEAERNGKTVWLVLAGDYSSRQAALDAKSSLPAKLREAGPFPRKMADIRGEI